MVHTDYAALHPYYDTTVCTYKGTYAKQLTHTVNVGSLIAAFDILIRREGGTIKRQRRANGFQMVKLCG